MNYTTKFNIGDVVYLLEYRECYKAKVLEIDVKETQKGGVRIDYLVAKEVSKGLLRTEIYDKEVSEENLFPTKDDVKNKLAEIELKEKEAIEIGEKFPDNNRITLSYGYGAAYWRNIIS